MIVYDEREEKLKLFSQFIVEEIQPTSGCTEEEEDVKFP